MSTITDQQRDTNLETLAETLHLLHQAQVLADGVVCGSNAELVTKHNMERALASSVKELEHLRLVNGLLTREANPVLVIRQLVVTYRDGKMSFEQLLNEICSVVALPAANEKIASKKAEDMETFHND